MTRPDLVHDWNLGHAEPGDVRPTTVMLDDEPLRDGLQSPSVVDPPIALPPPYSIAQSAWRIEEIINKLAYFKAQPKSFNKN